MFKFFLVLFTLAACSTMIDNPNVTQEAKPVFMTKDEVLAEIANPSLEIKADFDDAAYQERLLNLMPMEDLKGSEKTFKSMNIKAVDISKLPEDVDLREFATKVKSQGSEGTCTSFGMTATQEAMHCITDNTCNLDLSERHRWNMYNKYSADVAMQTIGKPIAPEAACPYTSSSCPASVEKYAKYKIGKMYRLQSKGEVLQALADKKAVYFWSATPQDMVQCKTTITSNAMSSGGHAYSVVGFFQKNDPVLIVKNSWGASCGNDNGYQYMKFSIFDKAGYWGAAMMDSASVLDKVPSLPVCKTVCEWIKTGRTFFSYRKVCTKRCE